MDNFAKRAKKQDIAQIMAQFREAFEPYLEQMLTRICGGDVPQRLCDAMRYSVLGGGKRIRPFLVMQSCQLCHAGDYALPIGAALELVHCYSLVHDDLPAMDDDDLRRGQPTLHKAYDEASAILAGDALLTGAFEVLAGLDCSAEITLQLVMELAQASGAAGMVGGQMRDLISEGRYGEVEPQNVALIQEMKTGALFRFAMRSGGIVARADAERQADLTRYGVLFGQAFQISDDILDAVSSPQEAGKATLKDAHAGKMTAVDVYGLDGARVRLRDIIEEIDIICADWGAQGDVLAVLAQAMSGRRR